MSDYRRNWIPGGTFFFTVTLKDRRSHVLTDRIGFLRQAVAEVRRVRPFAIDAWVVLPDHLHCIWTLPDGDADYAERWRLIKLAFVKKLPREERVSATQRRRGERGVWQRRYWEHTIRSETDFNNHVDYVHANPVKHGYVKRVRDWPYSTFHRYVTVGVLPPDWCGDLDDLPTSGE